jgi:hypothetical protein
MNASAILQRVERARERPRLLCSDRLGELGRSVPPGSGDSWSALKRRAHELASGARAFSPVPGEAAHEALVLAMAYEVWGYAPFLEGSLRVTRRLLALRIWGERPGAIDESTAVTASALALLCDLSWGRLPHRMRSSLLHRLEARAIGIFPAVHRQRGTSGVRWDAQATIDSHIGVATMALPELLDDWRAGILPALRGVLEFLDRLLERGGTDWSPSRRASALGDVVWFSLLASRFAGKDLGLFRHPGFIGATEIIHESSTRATTDAGASAVDVVRAVLFLLCPEAPVSGARSGGGGPANGRTTELPTERTAGGPFAILQWGDGQGCVEDDVPGGLCIGAGSRVLLAPGGLAPIQVADEGQPESVIRPSRILAANFDGPIEWLLCEIGRLPHGVRSFRRCVAHVPPDVVVILDEVSADWPRHLRWQVSYTGEASIAPRSFVVREAGSVLTAHFPLLDRRARYRFTNEIRERHSGPRGACTITRRKLITLSPLHPRRRWIVGTVIQVSDREQAGNAEPVALVGPGGVTFDLRPLGCLVDQITIDVVAGRLEPG